MIIGVVVIASLLVKNGRSGLKSRTRQSMLLPVHFPE